MAVNQEKIIENKLKDLGVASQPGQTKKD